MKPKIVLTAIALGLAVLLLTACGTSNAVDGTAQPVSSPSTAAPVTPTATSTATPTTPTSSAPETTPPTSSPGSMPNLVSGPGGIVYTNQTLGFQITFPKDWDGYFKIVESRWGIAVNFYGKSKTGTIGEADIGIEGLRFFIITSDVDEPSLDSVQKIGTAENVDYYYAHPGLSEDLGELFDLISDPDAASSYPYTVDQTELDLAAQDWAQAKQMRSEVQGVIDSFKAI